MCCPPSPPQVPQAKLQPFECFVLLFAQAGMQASAQRSNSRSLLLSRFLFLLVELCVRPPCPTLQHSSRNQMRVILSLLNGSHSHEQSVIVGASKRQLIRRQAPQVEKASFVLPNVFSACKQRPKRSLRSARCCRSFRTVLSNMSSSGPVGHKWKFAQA